MALYFVANGPMPTTAAQAVVTTGTAIKTLLQVKMGGSSNHTARVVEWGISFDGSAAAAGIKCELLCTGTVGGTITEFVAADIINIGDPNAGAVTDDFPFAFTASGDESGYTATAEGTITATRMFDVQLVSPTGGYVKQFPLGREPVFKATEFCRIRVTAAAAVNAYCYMIIDI
jgi:hypothetical protein